TPVGDLLNIPQLPKIDRVVIRGASGQIGDLVITHIDAVAADHRATVVDGDAVQVGQVTRHHQVQLVAIAVHAQVGASGCLGLGQVPGDGQRGVIAKGLADSAAGISGKAQAIVLGRDLGTVVGHVASVVDDEVVAQPGFTPDRQVVGGDLVTIDGG